MDPWVMTHCPGCRVDIDVPRSEWISNGNKAYCEECGSNLVEIDFPSYDDKDPLTMAMERRYDYADMEYGD
jgi:hypothetical protein